MKLLNVCSNKLSLSLLYFKHFINLKTLEVGGKLPPFPPGYSPGGNRILMAGYRPARLEFVV